MVAEQTNPLPVAAVASPPPPGGSPPPAPSPGLRLDPVASWKKHPLLGLGFFLLFAALGVPFSAVKGKPVYSATATVFVSPRFIANLDDGGKQFELASNSQ